MKISVIFSLWLSFAGLAIAQAPAPLSDFSLTNVNTTVGSDRVGETIEPKQYRQQVLGVYFGHET